MRIALFFLSLGIGASSIAQTRVMDSLHHIVVAHSNDTIGMDALIKIAVEYARTDLKKSKEILYRTIRLAEKLKANTGLSGVYSLLTTNHQNSGNLDSARYYLSLLEALAKSNPSAKILSNYYGAAGLFNKNVGNYKEALVFMLKALDLLDKSSQPLGRAGQLLNIGNVYDNLGEQQNAAKYHMEALKLFEALGNERGQSFCLQNLGNDFLNLNDHKTARKYFLLSLKLKEKIKDERGKISAWTGLGHATTTDFKKLTEGKAYYNKALQQAIALNLVKEQSNLYFHLGLVEKNLHNRKAASAFLRKSLEISKTLNDNMTSAKIQAELSRLSTAADSVDLIETSLLNKIAVASKSGDKRANAAGHRQLAEHYASKKAFNQAFEHLTKYMDMQDSLGSQTALLKLKDLEKQYESEKKEHEITLLKTDQRLKAAIIAKQKSEQILVIILLVSVVAISSLIINRYRIINRTKRQVELEKMRNHIARDLHDDIGSTLSSINIICQLALNSKEDTSQHLRRIAENSTRMMENMEDMVWSINPRNDSFENVLVRIKEFAAEILEPQGIAYKIIGEEAIHGIKFDAEKRKNLFLIFKEALNNAAKYSKASEITIKIERVNTMLHFEVLDNGKGFDISSVKNGDGIKNMESRAASMKGSLTQKSNYKEGTAVKLEMPIT